MRGRKQTTPAAKRRLVPANRFDWPEDLADILGRAPDLEVARLAGVHRKTATQERRRRGIPPFRRKRSNVEWTDEMIALLGTDSDGRVAAELGIHKLSVARKRRLLGIPPALPAPTAAEGFAWTQQAVALLGTASDGEVGRTLGISAAAVHFKRRLLGIPSFAPPPERVTWTPEMLAALGTISDARFAARFGIHLSTVAEKRAELGVAAFQPAPGEVERTEVLREVLDRPNREALPRAGIGHNTASKIRKELGIGRRDAQTWRWTPDIVALLGRLPDAQIATRIGVTPGAVRAKRVRLGIPRHGARRPWTSEERALVGTAPDEEIAARINRSVQAVAGKRKASGIPEHIPKRRRSS